MAQQLPDRHFAGPGAWSALYLFRQPFVVLPFILASLAWGGYLVSLVTAQTGGDAGTVATMLGIALMCGFGFAVLTALPGFAAYRLLTAPKPSWQACSDEEALDEFGANHFLGDEGRGGRLYVTNQRLVFLPHRVNVQLDPCEVFFGDILAVGWRNITRKGQVLSTTLELATKEGDQVFVVKNAFQLAARVDELIAAAR
ncbi:MAG: hypothetical protein AAGA56_11380 [Myxococcota bacterium]